MSFGFSLDRYGHLETAMCGAGLGVVAGVHLTLLVTKCPSQPTLTPWCLYCIAICIFHLMEFVVTAVTQPEKVTSTSFLLNHSRAYHIATAASIVEFWLEWWLAPSLKQHSWIMAVGFVIVATGQTLRTLAMYTAGSNFTHLVASVKAPGHVLVQHGVYRYLRHPSYSGWYWWSIATQVMLCNPLCTVAYAFASWRFFADRIPDEEEKLLAFFGEEYWRYSQRSYILIPAIQSTAASVTLGEAREQASLYQRLNGRQQHDAHNHSSDDKINGLEAHG